MSRQCCALCAFPDIFWSGQVCTINFVIWMNEETFTFLGTAAIWAGLKWSCYKCGLPGIFHWVKLTPEWSWIIWDHFHTNERQKIPNQGGFEENFDVESFSIRGRGGLSEFFLGSSWRILIFGDKKRPGSAVIQLGASCLLLLRYKQTREVESSSSLSMRRFSSSLPRGFLQFTQSQALAGTFN